MSLSLVSKTSGCEPVMVCAGVDEPLEEIPIYRPFDKATIWEQSKIVEFADGIQVDVFLWECMGLEPEYVGIMQRDWMQDDLATITNTYPDHEDIQGPSGLDVAESIAKFIPQNSSVITSEEIMLPILKQRSTQLSSDLTEVSLMQRTEVTEDILEFFPYEEHPNNIALVLSLAEAMAVDKDYALREMIERVKPDIGVLKIYPLLHRHDRSLVFSNGFSANEKMGCLSNWTRLGLDSPRSQGTWVSCLVNNRDDRSTRSRVFAQMLAEDLTCHQFFVMGSNCLGFRDLYLKATKDYISKIDLTSELGRYQIIERLNKYLNIPHKNTKETSNIDHHTDSLRPMERWQNLKHSYQDSDSADAIRELYQDFLSSRIIVLPHESQDPLLILETVIKNAPPSTSIHLHGIQNIKGPGLRFLEFMEDWANFHRVSQLKPECRFQQFLSSHEKNDNICDNASPLPKANKGSEHSAIKRSTAIVSSTVAKILRPVKEISQTLKAASVYKKMQQGKMSYSHGSKEIRDIQSY